MKFSFFIMLVSVCLTSCTSPHLPAFSTQTWHVDAYTGNAVSSAGLEVAFGAEWMITDTTLIQTSARMADFPKLADFLAAGIAQFPEIAVDSVLFYNPHRGLLFATYHQLRPLKPATEICLYDEPGGAYSPEFAKLFGRQYTHMDDSGWENGPENSVYTNAHYRPAKKQIVSLQRIPFRDCNIAVFQIWATGAKGSGHPGDYPPGTFWNIDLGDTDNIEIVSAALQASRNLAVENLKISLLNK